MCGRKIELFIRQGYSLRATHENRHMRVLHRTLASEPAFFVEVIGIVYRAEGQEPRDLFPEEAASGGRDQHREHPSMCAASVVCDVVSADTTPHRLRPTFATRYRATHPDDLIGLARP